MAEAHDVKSRVAQKLALIEPESGNLPASIFTDPDLFYQEVRTLFLSSWQFLAHASEIPENGDFVTRVIGQQDVIVARGSDGEVRAFYNLCRHRGMRVCRVEHGNTPAFRCPYHGFTYRNTGELSGIPQEKSIFPNGRVDKGQLGLYPVRIEIYRDMIFGTLGSQVEPLEKFLGNMRWYLDLIVGRAPMEVLGPPHRWIVPSNWKIPSENFLTDAYHTLFSHRSISEIGMAPKADFAQSGYHVNAGGGHGRGIGSPADVFMFDEGLRSTFASALSADQVRVLESMKNAHGTVFPNLSFLVSLVKVDDRPISLTTIRLWEPLDVNQTRIWSWFLVEKDASADWKERSRQAYILTFGPSGIFEQDDTENWTDITQNLTGPAVEAKPVELLYQMGMGQHPLTDFAGPGDVYQGKYSEANARSFYRRWLDILTRGEGA
ncbi:aromatic ring-hydroxylating dioxygenase subunit alpha [Sulfobacillus harzensis]|uniref:Aromatic ring-hydroxylating dioxygenase subunit alpha n=1 Tax=Sulfobacillus harzensis TaxID=2729629 RepID=A0A7Y0L452_9FIRM|nr:aromatic ring-hydroxylating dioxygenase subunit alpha [Sulfobacillus harzensis]NMP22738.1 aromatic ring-hydroxylating dioxygenase subunit alpha [Sulfobacillus harzensis]